MQRTLITIIISASFFALATNTVFADSTKKISKTEDSKQVQSPDGKHFAFVRSSGKTVQSGSGDASADSIWYGDVATKDAKPLFDPGQQIETKQKIGKIPLGDLSDLTFSDNGNKLFFLSACYATSGALIVADLNTHQIKYVADANSVQAIRSGKHKGQLLITRHTYKNAKEGSGSSEKPEYIQQ